MAVRQWWTTQDAINLMRGTNQMYDRDALGREVRKAWIAWARQQIGPKPSWLVEYDDLTRNDQEADRQIGEALYNQGIDAGADFVLNELAEALDHKQYTVMDGSETWDGDVSATLYRLLYDARVLNDENGRRDVPESLRGQIAYQLTTRLVIDMPTARAVVDAAIRNAWDPVAILARETADDWYKTRDPMPESMKGLVGLFTGEASSIPVKQLDWHECMVDRGDGYSEPTGEWEALTPMGGYYYINVRDGSDSPYWYVTFNDNEIADKESPDEAKAAAQEDFQKRVLAMIDA